jgi:predicted N-acetyltransferase YhbS
MDVREAVASDVEACGRIMHSAFRGIAEAHGFPPDIASDEMGRGLAGVLIASPTVYAYVAEQDGRVVGSNFVFEGDPIRSVGPLTVEPALQGGRIGRRLMETMVERTRGALGVRFCADAFNRGSVPMYAALGFDVKEPLLLMAGTCRTAPAPGFAVRPFGDGDLDACARVCSQVHGVQRSAELRDAAKAFKPYVVERDGRITGYLTAATFWQLNHGLAEIEGDMRALIAGASAASQEPVAFLLPIRQANLFRWCLAEGLRIVKPMLLMTSGFYQEPAGAWFPSVFY